MENVIHDLETFYNYNMRVKKMMTYSPRLDMGEEETIEYVDKLFKNIVYMKDIFIGMIQLCGESNQAFDYVIKLFAKYQNLLLKCHYNPKKLQVFYNECISSMNTSLIESINREIMGYYLFNDYIHLLFKCKTINEMLHLFHAYVVNTESFYDNTPVVEAKKINNQEVYLRGDDSELASNLFKAIDFDLGSDKIDIISFSNNKFYYFSFIFTQSRPQCDKLAIKVRLSHYIAIYKRNVANTRSCHSLCCKRSHASHAEDSNAGFPEPFNAIAPKEELCPHIPIQFSNTFA